MKGAGTTGANIEYEENVVDKGTALARLTTIAKWGAFAVAVVLFAAPILNLAIYTDYFLAAQPFFIAALIAVMIWPYGRARRYDRDDAEVEESA